ncbi:MAG: hypothetical protein M1268_03475 [Patescibacteria group bacterium]|nr:hypothetical protein [Patescibacteria group bacterium]
MDGEVPVQNQPKKNYFLSFVGIGLFGIIFADFFLLLIFGTLNYFNILSVSDAFPKYLGWLPHKTNTLSKPNQVFTPTSVSPTQQKNNLVCPVPQTYCSKGKQITYNGNPALLYNLPSGTKVKNIAKAVSFEEFIVQPYKEGNPKGFYQTYIADNICYTVIYTMPSDTSIKKVDLLPVDLGTDLATISAKTFLVNNEEASLLLQIQKKPMDRSTAEKSDFMRCTTTNLQPLQFGDYQSISNKMFE